MRDGQKEILKELIIQPLFETICDAFPNDPNAIISLLMPMFNQVYGLPHPLISSDVIHAFQQLRLLHNNQVNLHTTFRNNMLSLVDLRSILYESILELMHDYYPTIDKMRHPIINFAHDLTGMARIRSLVSDYITKTEPGHVERYVLAHEITLEKQKLRLPCFYPYDTNVFTLCVYAPGDFSYLDLSHLSLLRPQSHSHGNFKSLIFKHANLDGCSFNIQLYGANFESASLRGVDFSQVNMIANAVFKQANLAGALLPAGEIVPKNTRHWCDISNNHDELVAYRRLHFSAVTINPSPLPSDSAVDLEKQEESINTMPSFDSASSSSSSSVNQEASAETIALRAEVAQLKAQIQTLRAQLPDQQSPSATRQSSTSTSHQLTLFAPPPSDTHEQIRADIVDALSQQGLFTRDEEKPKKTKCLIS